MNFKLYNEDCLEGMNKISDGAVDLILTDLPFGTTDCHWDRKIPLEPLWKEFARVAKENAAIILFSQMPFGAELIRSSPIKFRYEIIWHKPIACGFFNANKMPLRCHENILVFYRKLPTYNPQFSKGKPYKTNHRYKSRGVYREQARIPTENDGEHYYPRDILKINQPAFGSKKEPRYHSTQKPIKLLEYLIKTYSNEGETVLDATMGSGSTGVACLNTNRKFVGFELDKEIFLVSEKRIQRTENLLKQRLFL